MNLWLYYMSDLLFQVASATNYADKCRDIFHKFSRSVVSWESTDYAITPIEVLFKLQELTFVTEIYMHPKLYKSIKVMQIFVSDNQLGYESIAKIYDFNDGVRIEISKKCRYIKLVILQKQHGRSASIDFLKVYGHQYFKTGESQPLYSAKKEKIEKLMIQLGIPAQQKWDVDPDTLITLHDMSKLKSEYLQTNNKQLKKLNSDVKTVLQLGRKMKNLTTELKWAQAKKMYNKIKQIKDQIKSLEKRRDYFDEKYQTSRFDEMIALDENSNFQDETLKRLLQQDRLKLQQDKRRKELEQQEKNKQIEDDFDKLQQDEEDWWKKQNELDKYEIQQKPIPITIKNRVKQTKKHQQEEDQSFKFKNPYVYNQGDADMEKFIKPLLNQFGPGFLGDPELLRKYEQLELLDILGARIWVAAHSLNWRHRAAAVQAVLNFCEDKLPERYNNGKTKHLFLALMQFSRITAEDKVLQIYYLSLKIMTVALAPPICGDDVPPALVNKSIQKFINILIEKVSEMNQRAKETSLKTMIAIFNHPVADISIAINQCLKICKQELNVKFTPVEKQNPRIIQSRLQIVCKLLQQMPKQKKIKISYDSVLKLLVEGSLYHSHNDVRILAVKTLQLIYEQYPQGTLQWYKGLTGLKNNIKDEIQSKLKIT